MLPVATSGTGSVAISTRLGSREGGANQQGGTGQQTCALALRGAGTDYVPRGGCRVHSFPRDPPSLTTHPRFSEHPPWLRPGAWRKGQDSVQLQAGPSTAPRITDAQATQGHAGPRRDPPLGREGYPKAEAGVSLYLTSPHFSGGQCRRLGWGGWWRRGGRGRGARRGDQPQNLISFS